MICVCLQCLHGRGGGCIYRQVEPDTMKNASVFTNRNLWKKHLEKEVIKKHFTIAMLINTLWRQWIFQTILMMQRWQRKMSMKVVEERKLQYFVPLWAVTWYFHLCCNCYIFFHQNTYTLHPPNIKDFTFCLLLL